MTTPTTQREADERTQQVLDLDRLEVEVRSYEKFGYVRARIPIADALTLIAKARASLTPTAPAELAGYKLVPLKCTPEMRAAWDRAPQHEDGDVEFFNAYRAMIDATPTAPQAASPQAGHDYDDPTLACASCGLTMGESRTLCHIKLGILAPQAATTASAAASQAADDEQASLERFAKDIRHHILHQAYTWLPAKHAKTMENMVGGMSLRAIVDAYAPVQAAQPALPAEPVMADGKTKLSDYLENTLPDDRLGDDWTKGFEECKRRLFKVVGAQLRRLAAPGAAQTTDTRGRALEEAAQMCEQQEFSDGDTRARSVAKGCAAAIRALKSDRATHPADKGQTNE